MCCTLQARYERRGEGGGGCLAEEGEVPSQGKIIVLLP